MRHRKTAVAVVVGTLFALPVAGAAAHVTLQPNEVPAAGFARLDVRVPNERDNAGTTKVDVQFPDGFYFVSYEPVPGWNTKVVKEKLAEPVEEHGEEITEQVDRVVFTAQGGAKIAPGQFGDFGLSVGTPEKPGALTFKALQTYENGEVVRWIGPPDAEEPAPQVTLTAAEGEHGAAEPAAEEEGGEEEGAAPAAEEEDDDDGPSTGLVIAALILGAIGTLAGVGALLSRRSEPAGA